MTNPRESAAIADSTRLSDAKRKILDRFILGGFEEPLEARPVITKRPSGEPVPLSYPQLQVWLHAQMAADVPFYNEALTIYRHGHLAVDGVERCLLEMIRRHEIWRTTFDVRENGPVQVIRDAPSNFMLPLTDLRAYPEAQRETEVRRLATEDARIPFDLKEGPLLRARIVCVNDDDYRLHMVFHQIIFDAVSAYGVILPELAALYEAFSKGQPSPLPELAIQYGDFAYWQRKKLLPEAWSGHMAFWRKQLSGELPVLEWMSDHPRPRVETHRGEVYRFMMTADLIRPLREVAQREGSSLYMAMLAGFATLLSRYTGQEDLILGSPTAGRKQIETEPLLGYFVNPVALRIDLSGDPTFRELLARVRGVVLDALSHEDVPFPQVVSEIQPKPDPSRNPLFQIMLSQQPKLAGKLQGWNLATEEVSNGGSKLDLTVVLDDRGDEVFGPITYNPDLFDSSTISRMVGHWQTLLGAVAVDLEKPISELPILTGAERQQIVIDWSNIQADYPKDVCLHELFEARVERTPDAVAVAFENEQLTYNELNARANRLAHRLRKLGVRPETLVGMFVERSIEMVVGILGILKASGAYVPLDPVYPKDRLTFVLKDAQVPVVLTQRALLPNLPKHMFQIICLDTDWDTIDHESSENLGSTLSPHNLAYVIYTSGSTGKPKGVLVTHFNVVRLFEATQPWYRFSERDTWTLFHSYAFDFSVWEIWGALLFGGRLVVVPYWVSRSPADFYELLSKERVTVLNQTPSAFHQLIQIEDTAAVVPDLELRLVIFGGEALDLQSLKPWFERHGDKYPQLVNMYGITETTVHVTYRPLTAELSTGVARSLIGQPIPDLKLYILDPHRQLVPIGIPGEMYVGGAGVARGYLNRPELTSERFILDPLSNMPGARLYRTGDLARYLPDGDIEYLGRIDHQVKIRGFRIELGEIESVLREHQAVHDARVIVREDIPGDRRLTGYLVLVRQQAASLTEIRSLLKEKLPSYMIPELVVLDHLPLTSNGKLDSRALPAPERATFLDVEPRGEPQDDIQELLAQLWRDILKVEGVSIYDNFFDLGGHSLSAVQLVARLQDKLGVRVKPNEVAFQTLGQLATVCRERLHRQ